MRKSRLLNMTVALGLVAGLFATVFGGASAQEFGPSEPGSSALFFPFVYNNTEIGDTGEWDGAIVVQNVDIAAQYIDIYDAEGNLLQGNVLLNPRASKSFTADALGVEEGGEGVIVVARWADVARMIDTGLCTEVDFDVDRGSDEGGTDQLDTDDGTAPDVTSPDRARVPGFDINVDYNISISGDKVLIDWSPDGDEPAEGTTYTVTVWDCSDPSIAGAEKHVTPGDGNPINTDDDQNIVSGYTAIAAVDLLFASDGIYNMNPFEDPIWSLPELDLENQYRWILPIAQTNTGWNSVIRITNVSPSNAGVVATWYSAGGQGVYGPSEQLANGTLQRGETLTIDLEELGVPEGAVGSVWIESDGATVALVDRVKSATDMAITNTAQPRTDLDADCGPFDLDGDYTCEQALALIDRLFGVIPTTRYAPLVFRDYNGWNTGINIANLSSSANQVTITYYNYSSNAVGVETINIPPRAMEFVYRPYTGNFGLAENQITSAVVKGNQPLAAVVDEVKYTGGQGAGHAMSYAAQGGALSTFAYDTGVIPVLADLAGVGRVYYGSTLSLPLVQKGSNLTGFGDTSGINLFNADPDDGLVAWIQFVNPSGLPAPPTVQANDGEQPFQLPLGPLASATVYTMNYSEMSGGFTGSAVVGVVSTELSADAFLAGPLVGVSNNVNYEVDGDGSTVYNMTRNYHGLPTAFGIPYPIPGIQP